MPLSSEHTLAMANRLVAAAESQDELNRLNRRGHAGYTIALAPLVFGLIGHWLDGLLGWSPWLALSLAVYALIGAIVHTMVEYRREMAAEDRTPVWTRGATTDRAQGQVEHEVAS